MSKKSYVTVELPESLRSLLEEKSQKDYRSMSSVVRLAIRSYLNAS
jgi:metal-responsive CopG/Arc/MetJ family transcriptional regulator